MIGPQHDDTRHPVTGKDLTAEETNVPNAAGEITRIVADKKGRTILVYRDGRLLVRLVEGREIVWQMLTPQITLQ
jgi:hypothetical protein